MLYFKALAEGLDPMPGANPEVRAAIDREARAKGWPAMHAELALVDPITAARLAPADGQRIQRALEVYRASGLPLSHFHSARPAINLDGIPLYSTPPPALISLEPEDRTWLHERIAQRFDAMLAQGFLDEVRSLRARGDLHPDLPSMRCVGYRQAWEALDAGLAVSDAAAMEEMRYRGICATRQLAKRQITWLRSMPHRQVVAADQPEALERVLQQVRDALQARRAHS